VTSLHQSLCRFAWEHRQRPCAQRRV